MPCGLVFDRLAENLMKIYRKSMEGAFFPWIPKWGVGVFNHWDSKWGGTFLDPNKGEGPEMGGVRSSPFFMTQNL